MNIVEVVQFSGGVRDAYIAKKNALTKFTRDL